MWFLALLMSCTASPEAGDRFVGLEYAQTAISCQSRVIPSAGEWWVTFTVRTAPGVEVDWNRAQVPLSHAEQIREDPAVDSQDADGWQRRMRTLWFRGAPPPGAGVANAQIGPHLVPVRQANGSWTELAGESCRPSVER